MKKLFSLTMMLLLGLGFGFAQDDDEDELDESLQFAYRDGTIVPNGSVVNVSTLTDDPFGGSYIASGLYVKNTLDDKVGTKVTMTVTNLHSGAVQFCMMSNCTSYHDTDAHEKQGILTGGKLDDMMLEWFPGEVTDSGVVFNPTGYGTTTADLHIDIIEFNDTRFPITYGDVIGTGPTITVNFTYADLTGISNVEDTKAQVVARYNAAGARIPAPVRGLNILRMSNGTTIKQLIK